MWYASHMHSDFEYAEGYGWGKKALEESHDWKRMLEAKNKEITRLNGAYGKILAGAGKEGVHVFEGHGSLVDAHTVKFKATATGEEKTITGEYIVVSVGGWPSFPDEIPGAREFGISSNEVFYLPERPQRVLVVGGGYIAVEFAGIFRGLGSAVTQMYRGPLFLRGFDDDVRRFLLEEMKKKGIDVQLEATPTKLERPNPNGPILVHTNRSSTPLEFDAVLFATGRKPKLEGLGLDKVGVKVGERGQIVVDEWSRTNVPNIYAVGDCTDRVQLTPVALKEGHYLADALFTERKRHLDYDLIPSAVFSQPEIGTVGLTEAQAVQKYQNVSVFTTSYKAMKLTMVPEAKERAYMKLIVDDNTDRVVGIHVVGEHAGEIIQGFAVAMTAGATKKHFDDTIAIHPIAAEELVTMRTPSYRFKDGARL